MITKPQYRNSARTDQLIKKIFLEMFVDKNISDIRVKHILDTAKISKGTFYFHFRDIYDVREKIEADCVNILSSTLEGHSQKSIVDKPFSVLLDIFKQIDNNFDFYRLIFKSKNTIALLNPSQKYFECYMISDKLVLERYRGEVVCKTIASFLFTGCVITLQNWFENSHGFSLDNIADLLGNGFLGALNSMSS
jgi:AcrR family transcriptional regulator